MTYACPNCGRDDDFWAIVEGWTSCTIDKHGEIVTKAWNKAEDTEPTGEMGCAHCEWGGQVSDLDKIGWDGKKISKPRKGQLEITEAQS